MHSWLSLSSPINFLSFIVYFRNCSTRFDFPLSSTVILVTLVRRKYITGSMSGIPFSFTHSSFVAIKCSVSTSCLSNIGEFSFKFLKLSYMVMIPFHTFRWIVQWIHIYNPSWTVILSRSIKTLFSSLETCDFYSQYSDFINNKKFIASIIFVFMCSSMCNTLF